MTKDEIAEAELNYLVVDLRMLLVGDKQECVVAIDSNLDDAERHAERNPNYRIYSLD